MKKLLVLLLCLCSVALFAQGEQVVIDKFESVFLGVVGIVYFVLVFFLKNASWLPSWLNTKLLAAIVGSIVALISVFVAGLPPLGVGSIIAIVGTLYNFVKGYIDSVKASAKETATKKAKIGSK